MYQLKPTATRVYNVGSGDAGSSSSAPFSCKNYALCCIRISFLDSYSCLKDFPSVCFAVILASYKDPSFPLCLFLGIYLSKGECKKEKEIEREAKG